jgi:hypothetical protein
MMSRTSKRGIHAEINFISLGYGFIPTQSEESVEKLLAK